MLGGLPLCSERGVQREMEEVRTQEIYVFHSARPAHDQPSDWFHTLVTCVYRKDMGLISQNASASPTADRGAAACGHKPDPLPRRLGNVKLLRFL